MAKARSAKKGSVKRGDAYECTVCGLAVSVDEICGCVDVCDIICCEAPMRPRKKAVAKKRKA